MIDHTSIGVKDLESAGKFYEAVLSTIGLSKLVEKTGTIGFGKKYAEFWLNHRPDLMRSNEDSGVHIAIRARSTESVNTFYSTAIKLGATCEGKPGFRPEYSDSYYAAFIRDLDGNKIEAVTFVKSS